MEIDKDIIEPSVDPTTKNRGSSCQSYKRIRHKDKDLSSGLFDLLYG